VSGSQGSYDLALNRKDHDLVFPLVDGYTDRYTIWMINGADKVAQQVKITLLAFFGEWFLDTTFGVPYLEDILVKNPHMPSVESILRSHILDVPHVTGLVSFTLAWDRQDRILSVVFEATTDYGPIQDSIRLEMMRV